MNTRAATTGRPYSARNMRRYPALAHLAAAYGDVGVEPTDSAAGSMNELVMMKRWHPSRAAAVSKFTVLCRLPRNVGSTCSRSGAPLTWLARWKMKSGLAEATHSSVASASERSTCQCLNREVGDNCRRLAECTSIPADASRAQRWLPMNPAPPVTSADPPIPSAAVPDHPWTLVARVHAVELELVLQRVHRLPETLVPERAQLALGCEPRKRLLDQLLAFADIVEDAPVHHEEA